MHVKIQNRNNALNSLICQSIFLFDHKVNDKYFIEIDSRSKNLTLFIKPVVLVKPNRFLTTFLV